LKYLIRQRGEKVRAHYWDGTDTACRMASTGGLRMDRFLVTDSPLGKAVCHMCQMSVDACDGNRFDMEKKSSHSGQVNT
jgi:hypothetical protein